MTEMKMKTAPQTIKVHTLAPRATHGWLTLGRLTVPCALGRAGVSYRKREGDGASPAGTYRLLRVLYRADRIARPLTDLPVRPMRPEAGWCDDPGHGRYNRPVRLPFPASHERLWRDDHLYDIVVLLDHNQSPRVRGAGSAVFFHLARPGYAPTEGCVAVSLPHMRRLLAQAGPHTTMTIA